MKYSLILFLYILIKLAYAFSQKKHWEELPNVILLTLVTRFTRYNVIHFNLWLFYPVFCLRPLHFIRIVFSDIKVIASYLNISFSFEWGVEDIIYTFNNAINYFFSQTC